MGPLRKSDLLAVRLDPGPKWPELIREAWDSEAAVLAVDPRLTEPEVTKLMEAARPTVLIEGSEPPVRMAHGVPIDPEVALVVATSGSGGAPRLAELSHGAVRAAVEAASARLQSTSEDPWLCCLPIAHIGGMLVILRGLITGAPVIVQPGFDTERFESEREARFTSLVPTMLLRLLKQGADLARFRSILVGGAALSDSLAGRARSAGARVVSSYGLTESCGGVVYDGLALPGIEVRIGDEDEIQLRGPAVMHGYRLDAEATEAALTGDGWLKTRDAGSLVDGHLRVLGRIDEVIVTGGEKVWPDEVEGVIREHEAVREVLVCGKPDPEWGERVVAYVVPSQMGSLPTLDALRGFVTERLASFKAPREMVLVESLPRTSSGKLLRPSKQ